MTEKQLHTFKARAALAGFALHAIRNDLERRLFVATAGAITLSFETLAEVDRWLSALPITQAEEGHA